MKISEILVTVSVLSSCIWFSCNESHNIEITEIVTPCKQGGESNLFVDDNGLTYLSWVEYQNDTTDALMYAVLNDGIWSEGKTIAAGSDWFVNWADFPSIVSNGNTLAAHWLQKSASGTYNYNVEVSQSIDDGKTWYPSFNPHTDGIAAEHGFVTMVPVSDNRIFATWLDGRNTKGHGDEETSHDDHGHGHGGAMTLRAAEFDNEGNLYQEAELDNRVCDCCQTSATLTDNGMVVVYRDRDEEEVRDISIVRQVDGKWTAPKTIFNDNWKIAGCPVNGPSVAAKGNQVAVAWFTTAEEEKPEVKIAFSSDGGMNFGLPIRVDEGKPLGRVDVAFVNNEEVYVSWLEGKEDVAEIRLQKFDTQGKVGESIMFSETSPSRKSGFPMMKKYNDQLLISWTDADSLGSRVRTAILDKV